MSLAPGHRRLESSTHPRPRAVVSLPSLGHHSSVAPLPPLPNRSNALSASVHPLRRNLSSTENVPERSALGTRDDSDGDCDTYSDVDFWGGESPRISPTLPLEPESPAQSDDASEADSEVEDEDEGEDPDGVNEEIEDADELMLDRMEIFGHR